MNTLRKFFILNLIFFILTNLSFGQKPPSSELEFEETYKKNIMKERLYGVYIPKDLYDAFDQLKDLMDEKTVHEFRALPEERAGMKILLIKWIVHNWSFYSGSRLSHNISQIGIKHPEHMAHLIVICFHRHLNNKELNIKERAEFYQKKIEEQQKEKVEEGTILHEETRIRPKEDGN